MVPVHETSEMQCHGSSCLWKSDAELHTRLIWTRTASAPGTPEGKERASSSGIVEGEGTKTEQQTLLILLPWSQKQGI